MRWVLADLYIRVPGAAYVVVPELSAGNLCSQIATHTSKTFIFAPGELSTLQGNDGITSVFNFEDLPCPPPDRVSPEWYKDHAANDTQEYSPVLAPFPRLYELDPQLKRLCGSVLDGGLIDPFTALPTASEPTPPGETNRRFGIGPGKGPRDLPAPAHKVSSLPGPTGSSTSAGTK